MEGCNQSRAASLCRTFLLTCFPCSSLVSLWPDPLQGLFLCSGMGPARALCAWLIPIIPPPAAGLYLSQRREHLFPVLFPRPGHSLGDFSHFFPHCFCGPFLRAGSIADRLSCALRQDNGAACWNHLAPVVSCRVLLWTLLTAEPPQPAHEHAHPIQD